MGLSGTICTPWEEEIDPNVRGQIRNLHPEIHETLGFPEKMGTLGTSTIYKPKIHHGPLQASEPKASTALDNRDAIGLASEGGTGVDWCSCAQEIHICTVFYYRNIIYIYSLVI